MSFSTRTSVGGGLGNSMANPSAGADHGVHEGAHGKRVKQGQNADVRGARRDVVNPMCTLLGVADAVEVGQHRGFGHAGGTAGHEEYRRILALDVDVRRRDYYSYRYGYRYRHYKYESQTEGSEAAGSTTPPLA